MTRSESASGPELLFGLATPVGTDAGMIAAQLTKALARYDYTVVDVDPAAALPSAGAAGETEDERVRRLAAASSDFCRAYDDPLAVAKLAVALVRDARVALHRAGGAAGDDSTLADTPRARTAYVVQSVKRPPEVEFLRRLYGPQFVLVAAQATPERRLAHLLESRMSGGSAGEQRSTAEALIAFDAQDRLGQRVNDTFHRADLFLGADQDADRFVRLIFGDASEAPTVAEHAMYVAQATAARSLTPSRHVGAALVQGDSVVALGFNDVPAGEHAEVLTGIDTSERFRREMLRDTVERLLAAGWQPPPGAPADVAELVTVAGEELRGGQLMSVIEYQRSVHAEVAAVSDAARRGVPVAGTTLYVTTYPCHLCYKAALAAGVAEVRYVEPYPKSRVTALYPATAARLLPYEGVAPRAYMRLFGERPPVLSDAYGRFVPTPPEQAQPLVPGRREPALVAADERAAAAAVGRP